MLRLAVLLASIAALTTDVAAQGPYQIAPPPPWVRRIAAAVPESSGAAGVGFEWLLVDRQEIVGAHGTERFWHLAFRVLDEGAVRDNSQVELVFDSSYQQLQLHSAVVRRGGRAIDQLRPDRIRVAQRETRLENRIYDGSLSVVLLLEDVRRGDVIEYSYTRRGANPVFGSHYMSSFLVQQTSPVHRAFFRLLWPRNRPLFLRRHDTTLEPRMRDTADFREYTWDQAATPPRLIDDDVPDWFDPLPYVQLSDFASWALVSAWGDSLFRFAGPLPDELAAPVATIRSASTSRTQWVLDALRFVQDEVRYLGVEIGVNSHRPYPPATVIRRRYGDCKDKALLLVTMLRALNVPARPALVSTTYRGRIRDVHPTASYFDHAIVQVDVDGRTYWIDPSALYQRGDLADAAAAFGAALVLGGADTLLEMPQRPSSTPLTDVVVTLELGGVAEPASMEVRTEYRSWAANATRSTFRRTSVEELQRHYTDFYATLYPSLHTTAPLEIRDDESANRIRTVEHYSIPEFWRLSGDGEDTSRVGTLEPLELSSVVPRSQSPRRTMPLAIRYPTHIRYTITARLSEGWSIAPKEQRITTPGARFSYRVGVEREDLTLAYEYETLADHVAAGSAVAKHLEQMARVRQLLTYTITPPGAPTARARSGVLDEVNWAILSLGLLVATAAAWGALRIHGLQTVAWPHGPAPSPAAPSGLGGWLVLVGIGVCVTPIRLLVEFAGTWSGYSASTWAMLTTPGSAQYHPLWAPLLLYELVANVTMLVFAGVQVSLYFRRKRIFPAYFVVFSCAQILLLLVDDALGNAISTIADDDSGRLMQPGRFIMALIWVWYMLKSERVKATFVH